MKIRIFTFLLAFCMYFTTNAQIQILFQSEQTKSFLLSHVDSYDESQKTINEFIDAIAGSIPKPVYQTKITLSIDESIKVTRQQAIVSIYVNYQNVVLGGDVFYKGFNMTDVLIPTKYDFKATLSYKNGPVIKSFVQQPSDFKPFNEILLQCNDTTLSNSYDFVVNNFYIYYDFAARNRFRDKARLIDQYNNADIDLAGINKQLSTIDPNAFEEADKTQTTLNNIKATIDNISSAAFWKVLHIETFDPAMLNNKLFDTQKRFSDIQNQLYEIKSKLDELYFNKALDLYKKKKTYDAKTNFEKSLSYNASYAPSQYYLARIAFETNKNEEARQLITKLFTFNDIDNETQKAAFSLAHAIEWTEMNKAIGQLTGGKFNEALDAVAKAENFCKSIPSYTCNDTIELIRRDCHRGIYNNYVKTASGMFYLKKYKEAGNEIVKAISYQQNFSKYIPDNDDALELKQKIGVEEYYETMTKGKEKMVAKDYRGAFDDFEHAKNLEIDYPVKKDKLLPDLLKKSKLEVLLLDLTNAESMVASNNLNGARTILLQVINDQRKYELIDNNNLTQRIEKIKKSIFSQECENAQNEYNSKVDAAVKAENEKNYIAAENNYNDALQSVEKNPDCDIKSDQAKNGKMKVEKPSQYQQILSKGDVLISNRDYYKAIDNYNKLTTYFNDNSIANFGIVHQPLHLYIGSFESGFVIYGLSYLIDAGETDNAMYLLKLLKQRNTLKSTTKIQQTSLARSFALRDHKDGNVTNPKLKVTEYTLGDPWYSYFEKEYLKQMKKLK